MRQGADFCGQPPPPPSPDDLCPTSIPADWHTPCLEAELFYEDPQGPQQADSLLPEVGNGHIAWKVVCDCLHIQFNLTAGTF